MSIVAVQRTSNGNISISCDKQTTVGRRKISQEKDNIYKDSSKIFQQDNLIVGCAGEVKESAFLKVYCKTHKPKEACEDCILDFLVEFMEWSLKKDKSFKLQNHYFFILNERIFESKTLLIREIKDYSAIGSGADFALAVLSLGENTEEAVKVAKNFDIYCSGETYTIKLN